MDWQYGDYYFPEIRSLGGAICMLSLVLYPYVYMLVRVAFLEQSTAVLEASRNLGKKPWQTLFLVALPMARPAIVAGVSLALMETLADYGTVAYFGVSSFTTGIFRTWYGLGELTTAAQLCAFLMLFVFALIMAERWSRQRLRFHHHSAQKKMARLQLSGWRSILAMSIGSLIVFLGFILPAAQLSIWASTGWQEKLNADFLRLLFNSFSLAAIAAVCCLLVAVFLAYTKRVFASRIELGAVAVASLGYAVPGTVIAVGVLIPVAWLDNQIDFLSTTWFELPYRTAYQWHYWSSGICLSCSIFIRSAQYSGLWLNCHQTKYRRVRQIFGSHTKSSAQPHPPTYTENQFAHCIITGLRRGAERTTHYFNTAAFQF